MAEEVKAETERAASPVAQVQEPEKKKKKESAEKVLGKFTHGDHMAHILFQKGKKFIPLCADDRTVNMIIEVSIGDQKQYSTVKSDVVTNDDSLVTWDEHMFFELKNLAPQQAKETSISIKILNQGWIKNELIGQANFDLASVYFSENNKIEHQWVALDNPDAEDFENMKGLMKISANVTGPNDNAQKLESHMGPEPETMKMFMSPSIKRTYFQLTISIIEGHDLPEFGDFMTRASLEAYFKASYGGGNPLKSKVKNQINKKVSVMQQFFVPVQTPVLQDRLVISAWDYNSIAADTIIGSLILSVKQLIAEGSKPGGFFIWKDLYGSPKEFTGAAADLMNSNPECASDWKGTILMHVQAEENDKPKKGVEDIIDDPTKDKKNEKKSGDIAPQLSLKARAQKQGWFVKDDYELMFEIGQGITLPGKDPNYRVQVSIQNQDWQCEDAKECKGEYVRWHNRSQVLSYKLPKNNQSLFTKSKDELTYQEELRIYVYLLNSKNEPISFWYGPLSDFTDLSAKWRWVQLKPDRTYGRIDEDHMAGMISVKISAARLAAHGNGSIPWVQQTAWARQPPKRVGAYTLRTFIFQCRDLPAADSDGTSDPFIKLFNTGDREVITDVIDDNLNPIFMECLEIGLDFTGGAQNDYSAAPPIIMDVLDADEGYISNSADFLGRCTIFLDDVENLVVGNNNISEPIWYDIKFGTDANSPACGQILASFSIRASGADVVDVTDVAFCPKRMNEMVPKKEYNVFINCLGLRELESIGLMPIQKAFVSFMIKSLTDAKTAGTIQNIATLPGPYGSNPNINSIIKFSIPLPSDRLYCPSLSCTVYDQVFLGFSQPQIGNFSIPLGKIMADARQEREDWISTGRWLIERLDARLEDRQIEEDIQFEEAKNTGGVMDTTNSQRNNETVFLDTQMQDPLIGEKKKKDSGVQSKIPKKKQTNENVREQQKLKQENKAQEKLERKEKARTAYNTMDASNNVLIPNYSYDEQLRVYREVLVPDASVFKSIGFNSQPLIKELMELTNKIPPAAAISEEIQQQNPMLAKKMRREMRNKMKQKFNEKLNKPNNTDSANEDISGNQRTDDISQAAQLLGEIYTKTNKHYRVFFEDELENDTEIFPKPIFQNAPIMRGQSRGVEKSMFSFGAGNQDESGQESTLRQVGTFKGVIDILNNEESVIYEREKARLLETIFSKLGELHNKRTEEEMKFDLSGIETSGDKANFVSECNRMQLSCVPKLVKFLEDVRFASEIKELLSRKTDAIAHLYVIQGYEFASRDIGSPSDPYLIIRCGDTEFNEVENYQDDEPNPKFNKRYDFNVSFPGAPPLVIEAYDYDLLFGDDLIGKTSIDLDDRFFNPKWVAIEEKPVETRELKHQSSSLNQGVIDLWVDIDPATKSSDCGKVWDLETEPTRNFEVRLSVYNCTGVPAEDAEGTSDVFIKAFIGEDDKQESDTHYRCTTGKPSFNYRLLFDVTTPTIKPYVLTMQAWDRDLLKSNDLICQWQVDITAIIRDSKITSGPIHLQKDYYETSLKDRMVKPGEPEPFTFPRKESEGDKTSTIVMTAFCPADPEKKKPIKIYCDLRVVPREYATANVVGAARSEPNVEPKLPQPVGRFQFSLNPIAMLNQMCGAALRRKIWCCICCVLCLVVIYFVFPILASMKTLFS